ncbi:MAG: LptF/LptG family permease [Candidatus Omnitrophica bacterium]|nr:LptF/LptG family permease [Candidatus Omnitrophota bacterium]
MVPFILTLLVLTCVFLLGNLIQLTHLVINKGVPLSIISEVFLLTVPVLLGFSIPIACLVSVIIAFSRFSADNEIIALRASGVHLWRLLAPLISVGIIISLFCIILNDQIIPYAHYKRHKLLKNLGTSNPTALLEAGIFINAFKGQILFIHKIEDHKLFNITIYQPQDDGPPRTIIAKRGEFTGVPEHDQVKLKLMDGTSDEPNLNNPDKFYKLNFDTFFLTLNLNKDQNKIKKKPKGMTLQELQDEIEHLQRLLIDDTARLVAEYHRKITWSFASLLFILLGFPMAVITHRREKSANIVLAIICGAFYYLLSLGCEAISTKTAAPIGITMWMPNILTAGVAVYLNIKCVS